MEHFRRNVIVWLAVFFVLVMGVVGGWSFPVAASANSFLFLPLVSSPEVLVPSEEALFQITPSGGLNTSTFTAGSFVLTNLASNSQAITKVRIDFRTAVFPDMVFDPNGVAGDTVAKNIQVDSNTAVYQSALYISPHDGGFDAVEITFSGFDPGESFTFSVDVDPTSIKGVGAPGPNESGSVSGLELVGTAVTVTFADGTMHTGQTYRIPISVSGSESLVRADLPDAPVLELVGAVVPPAVVTEANQIIRITGIPNRTVHLLVLEGGLFTSGVPGGGFDLDAFEANSVVKIQEFTARLDQLGLAELPISLTKSSDDGGLNYIAAVQENSFGIKGLVSEPIVLQYQAP